MEKIKVSRTSCDIAGGSISIPQTFRVGEVLSKVYAHEGPNSMPHKGILKVAAVKAPDFGERRTLILEDIATLTGGQVVTLDKGMKFTDFDEDWFGNCGMVTITKDQTTIVDGKGDSKLIEARIESLKQQIDKSQTPFEKEKIQERLAKMVGGVAVVYIGGNTETEIKEKKDRAEDALYATKAAIEDGILPGGGVALIHASKNYKYNDTNNVNKTLGEQIIIKAIQYPFIKILTNAGYEISDIYSKLSELKLKNNNWIGYDLGLNTMGDMKLAGIIDPTKVTKSALLNALSVASTTLLTECVIADKPDESNKNQNNLNEYI
jgi:chaperonin GroEL